VLDAGAFSPVSVVIYDVQRSGTVKYPNWDPNWSGADTKVQIFSSWKLENPISSKMVVNPNKYMIIFNNV
jgi:hypothetical protein